MGQRGSGETFARGTAASRGLVAAVITERAERSAVIHMRGGDLEKEWAEDNHVYKTGPAAFVCDGVAQLTSS